ncbi:hypothetical protein [Halorussus lipolyticus]|uniref:hypothetical protein n=1 Tax=Halorussus lipolyticus TaxID=3034024 RepID=UPI0023E7A47A|nr:hypothetical protein [Halorussus sp. DT80]
MPVTTRRSLLAAVGVSLASAGCVTDAGNGTGEDTTDESGSGAETAYVSKSPDPDHAITLRSEAGESEVRVRVVREATGETVFETTTEASTGEKAVYNLRQADPEDIEAFRICAELVGSGEGETESIDDSPRRDCQTIRTSECYADAHVTVEEDGSVQIVYAVC